MWLATTTLAPSPAAAACEARTAFAAPSGSANVTNPNRRPSTTRASSTFPKRYSADASDSAAHASGRSDTNTPRGFEGSADAADEGGVAVAGAERRCVDSYPEDVSCAPASPEAYGDVSSLGFLCAAAALGLAAGRFRDFLGSGFGSVDANASSSRRPRAANGSSELGWLDACLAFLFSASRRFFSASRASISFARSNAVMGFSSTPPGASLDGPAPAAEGEATAAVLPGSPTRFAPGGAGPAATPALCFRSSSYFFSSAISASDLATSLILGGMPARERVRWRHAD